MFPGLHPAHRANPEIESEQMMRHAFAKFFIRNSSFFEAGYGNTNQDRGGKKPQTTGPMTRISTCHSPTAPGPGPDCCTARLPSKRLSIPVYQGKDRRHDLIDTTSSIRPDSATPMKNASSSARVMLPARYPARESASVRDTDMSSIPPSPNNLTADRLFRHIAEKKYRGTLDRSSGSVSIRFEARWAVHASCKWQAPSFKRNQG